MLFTDVAQHGIVLGLTMARCGWYAEANQYPDLHSQMTNNLSTLGLDIELPESHYAFKSIEGELLQQVFDGLAEQRQRLGSDGYAFPFFVMSYYLFQLAAAEQLGQPLSEANLEPLVNALIDLGIDATAASAQAEIRRSVDHVAADTVELDDGETATNPSDVLMIWSLTLRRMLERWMEAERRDADDLPPLRLDAVPLHSCFISYSHHDEVFAEQLKTSLQLAGVEVWMAPDQIAAGDSIAEHIEIGLERYDKLVLVLSQNSMKSQWVRREIKQSLRIGSIQSLDVLVPVRLVSESEIKKWKLVDADSGINLGAEVYNRLVADFENWQQPDAFEAGFADVLEGLRRFRSTERKRREPSPGKNASH